MSAAKEAVFSVSLMKWSQNQNFIVIEELFVEGFNLPECMLRIQQ